MPVHRKNRPLPLELVWVSLLHQYIVIPTTTINHTTTIAEDIIMVDTTVVDTITIMDADTKVGTTTIVDTDTTMDVAIRHKQDIMATIRIKNNIKIAISTILPIDTETTPQEIEAITETKTITRTEATIETKAIAGRRVTTETKLKTAIRPTTETEVTAKIKAATGTKVITKIAQEQEIRIRLDHTMQPGHLYIDSHLCYEKLS